MEKKKILTNALKYGITLLVMTGMFFAVLGVRKYFDITDQKEQIRTLCDAFSIPGVLGFCVAILISVSGTGCFDGLAFVGRSILGAFIPGLKLQSKRYKDFKEDRDEHRKKISSAFLYICSAFFTGASLICLIFYYQV